VSQHTSTSHSLQLFLYVEFLIFFQLSIFQSQSSLKAATTCGTFSRLAEPSERKFKFYGLRNGHTKVNVLPIDVPVNQQPTALKSFARSPHARTVNNRNPVRVLPRLSRLIDYYCCAVYCITPICFALINLESAEPHTTNIQPPVDEIALISK